MISRSDAEEAQRVVLENMRGLSFRDSGGTVYDPPDTLEFQYGSCGGGVLGLRFAGGMLRCWPISGDWGDIPEGEVPESMAPPDFRAMAIIFDPRRSLALLTNAELEGRTLRGNLNLDAHGGGGDHALIEYTLTDDDRVETMRIVVRDSHGEENDLGTLVFEYV